MIRVKFKVLENATVVSELSKILLVGGGMDAYSRPIPLMAFIDDQEFQVSEPTFNALAAIDPANYLVCWNNLREQRSETIPLIAGLIDITDADEKAGKV